MAVIEINGLPLPAALVTAIRNDAWTNFDAATLSQVFKADPEDPCFYTLELMQLENENWPIFAKRIPGLCGNPDISRPPGDIDPLLSLLIGDLGPDLPFALDFRTSLLSPRVLFTPTAGRWVTIAPRIEDLLIGLGVQNSG